MAFCVSQRHGFFLSPWRIDSGIVFIQTITDNSHGIVLAVAKLNLAMVRQDGKPLILSVGDPDANIFAEVRASYHRIVFKRRIAGDHA